MPKSMQERLDAMQESWKQSKATYDQRFGGVKIDAGEYLGKLQKCELGVRRSDDVITMNVEYLIVGGKFDGYVAFDQMNLGNEWGRVFAMRFIEVAGYEAPAPDQIASTLQKVCTAIAKDAGTFKIEVIHNGDYVNIQPKALEDGDAAASVPAAGADDSKPVARKKAAQASAAESDPLNDLDRKGLKAYIREKELEIRVTTKLSDDDIRELIHEAEGTGEAEAEAAPSDEELAQQLLVLCKGHGIKEVKKDMALDDMISIVEEYEFAAAELDEDEVELLTTLQLTATIKE